MSLVALGSPWTELASEPPRKYRRPRRSKAPATRSAISSGSFSEGVIGNVQLQPLSRLAPVETNRQARAHLDVGRPGVALANASLCEPAHSDRQSHGLL